jgi:hypothetical protein
MSSFCCVLCSSVWSRIYASLFHSELSFPSVVLCVPVCGPVYTLVYPTVMYLSSCCVVCSCILSRLCATLSHMFGRSACRVMCLLQRAEYYGVT